MERIFKEIEQGMEESFRAGCMDKAIVRFAWSLFVWVICRGCDRFSHSQRSIF